MRGCGDREILCICHFSRLALLRSIFEQILQWSCNARFTAQIRALNLQKRCSESLFYSILSPMPTMAINSVNYIWSKAQGLLLFLLYVKNPYLICQMCDLRRPLSKLLPHQYALYAFYSSDLIFLFIHFWELTIFFLLSSNFILPQGESEYFSNMHLLLQIHVQTTEENRNHSTIYSSFLLSTLRPKTYIVRFFFFLDNELLIQALISSH